MTTPSGPVLGRLHLDDGLHSRLNWAGSVGLADGTATMGGAVLETFGEAFRVLPGPQMIPAREVTLSGYLLATNGMAEGWQRLGQAQEAIAGRPTRLQVGSLGLTVQTTGLRPDRLRAYAGRIDYSTTLQATPGAWEALYGYQVGQEYGITTRWDAFQNDAYQKTGPRFTLTNPGTAPTPIRVQITGPTSGTAVYLRCTAPGYTRRVVAAQYETVSGTWVVLPSMGLFVPPGESEIRVEQANGSTLASATGINLYGTAWRYVGNDDNRMSDPVTILTWTRRDPASVTTGTGTVTGVDTAIVQKQEQAEPRIGNVMNYSAATRGLVVERAATNILLRSQDFSATWTQTGITSPLYGLTAPDGTSTAFQGTSNAADSFVTQSVTLTSGTTYTFSVWLRATAGTNTVNIYLGDGAGSANTACAVTTTWTRFSVTRTVGAGAYYVQIGGGTTWATGEVLQAWGAQLETGVLATTYITTTTAQRTRDGDHGGFAEPQNFLLNSDRIFDSTASLGAGAIGGWYVTNASTAASRQTYTTGAPAWRIVTTVANGYVSQAVPNAEFLAGRKVTFSAWVRPGNGLTASLQIGQTSTGFISSTSPTGDGLTWFRITVATVIATSAYDTEVRISLSGIGNLDIFGPSVAPSVQDVASSHVSSSGLPPVYVPTLGSVAPPVGAWEWPGWLSQNGYVEFEILPPIYNSLPTTGVQIYMVGSGTAPVSLERASGTGTGSYNLTASRRYTDAAGSVQNATSTASAGNIWNGSFHTVRLEWQHYTLAGTRYAYFRWVVDGTQIAITANLAASSFTRWVDDDRLYLFQGLSWGTYRNLQIGAPILPSGSIPVIL